MQKKQGRKGREVSCACHTPTKSHSQPVIEGKTIIPDDTILQPAVGMCEGGQREEEIDIEEPCYDLEIVEQTALEHFNAVLQKAQEVAAEAEKKNPRKRPRKYTGKSDKTLRRHKKRREDLAKQGFLPVFDFIARMKERKQLGGAIAGTSESEQASQESAPEVLDTEALVSKRVGQVRRRSVLMSHN